MPVLKSQAAKANFILVSQGGLETRLQSLAVEKGAVRAAQVFDINLPFCAGYLSVFPGNAAFAEDREVDLRLDAVGLT